jgi:hypothetical protein
MSAQLLVPPHRAVAAWPALACRHAREAIHDAQPAPRPGATACTDVVFVVITHWIYPVDRSIRRLIPAAGVRDGSGS